jgi:tetratricopeptide (TPR) repeat protein
MHGRGRITTKVMTAGLAVMLLGAAGPSAAGLASAPKAAKARTLAFSNVRLVPTVSELQTDLTNMRSSACQAGGGKNGSVSFTKAIADARAVEHKAGSGAVHKIETGRDKHPNLAEVDATAAMMHGNPVGALAALLSAYDHDRSNPTHLRNIGAVLAQISMPQDALAVFNHADTLKAKPNRPMGISELDSERTNRGFALLELGRWKDARTILSKAVADQPLLSEAKINLSQADLCAGQPAKAAAMMFAGARRESGDTVDDIGTSPYEQTQVPAGQLFDVSQGKAGTMPTFTYPQTVKNVEKDGPSFKNFSQMYLNQSMKEANAAGQLYGSLYNLPPASQQRVNDMLQASGNAQMGGYQKLIDAVNAAHSAEDAFWTNTFTGQCGTACQEFGKISKQGGDPCTVQWPKMKAWLTSQTQQFNKDMSDWDHAQRAEWKVQSKWASGIIANIANKNVNKGAALFLDADKQITLYGMTSSVYNWELGVNSWSNSSCANGPGPGENPPSDTMLHPADCPPALKEHGFSFSVGFFQLSVNCEEISVTVEEEGLGPFGRVSVNRKGSVTITAGAHAGVSLGPASAGVEAGVYITVDSTGITDAGVTANASATASSHNVGLDVASAGYTASFTDASTYAGSLFQ